MITSISSFSPAPIIAAISAGPQISAVSGQAGVSGIPGSGAATTVDNRNGVATIAGVSLAGLSALHLNVATVQPVAGVLTLDVSQANTLLVPVTAPITAIAFAGAPPAGQSERVTVYFQQDQFGPHPVGGWAPDVKWQSGQLPVFSAAANAMDCCVFDLGAVPGAVLGNLVGLSYQ